MRFLLLSLVGLVISGSAASAQRSAPVGIEASNPLAERGLRAVGASSSAIDLGLGKQPRWVKAAVLGGVAGGALFAAMHAMSGDWNPQRSSMVHDLAIGTLGGAVVAGGSIAFYDWVCAAGSASENAGLCGHRRAYVLRSTDYTLNGPMRRR
jgi:hypothetical protein